MAEAATAAAMTRDQETLMKRKLGNDEDAGDVRANSEEGGDAEMQEPGVAKDDVQPEHQHGIDEERKELLAINRGIAFREGRGNAANTTRRSQCQYGECPAATHTFSRVRAPRRPVGRKIRTTIRIAKISASLHSSPT